MLDMTTIRTAVINWTPKVKSRPRNGRGHTYTPKATLEAERAIREQWEQIAKENGWEPFPAGTSVVVRLLLGSATIKVEVESLEDRKVGKGLGHRDIDNLAKLVLDSLNKTAYDDDKQIVELLVIKGED
jgi:Holliday junction resolvase RusA-like endonuclease